MTWLFLNVNGYVKWEKRISDKKLICHKERLLSGLRVLRYVLREWSDILSRNTLRGLRECRRITDNLLISLSFITIIVVLLIILIIIFAITNAAVITTTVNFILLLIIITNTIVVLLIIINIRIIYVITNLLSKLFV